MERCKKLSLEQHYSGVPKGTMFLKSVKRQVKDGSFIVDMLISVIEKVEPRNVVQVITNNTKNRRAAGLLVEEQYQHIF